MPHPSFRHERLNPANYQRIPWKNGGGTTIDIACAHLPGVRADDWSGILWRLGRTRIERPQPFSDLSGFDRLLSVIEGGGLVLNPVGAPPIDARLPFRPVCFPGEWPIVSELQAGGVGVLNLMTRRGRAAGRMAFLTGREEARLNADIAVLYAPAGPASFSVDDERFDLDHDEALRVQSKVAVQHVSGVLAIASVSLLASGG